MRNAIPETQKTEYCKAFWKAKEAALELLKLNDKAVAVADRRLLPSVTEELLLFKVNETPPFVAGIVKLQSRTSPELKKPVWPSVVMKPVTPSVLPGVLLMLYVAAHVGATFSRAMHTTSANIFELSELLTQTRSRLTTLSVNFFGSNFAYVRASCEFF